MVLNLNVRDIVVEKILGRIERDNVLPWQAPFKNVCMNWYSEREYSGLNRFLLDGAEYITPNQLKQYNHKNKTSFWFESGTPADLVVFFNKGTNRITEEKANNLIGKNQGSVIKTEDGYFQMFRTLRYYRVYDIRYIYDVVDESKRKNFFKSSIFQRTTSEGTSGNFLLQRNHAPILKSDINHSDVVFLTSKLGNTLVEVHTPAQKIVDSYLNGTGVKLTVAKFIEGVFLNRDRSHIYLPSKDSFKSTESFYRVLFHELTHSTGLPHLLNRESLMTYKIKDGSRSIEELIAEVGSLLLASEAGFRGNNTWEENSLNYINSWCNWMKENKSDLIKGIIQADKAKNFILSFSSDSSEYLPVENEVEEEDPSEASQYFGNDD